MIEPAILVLPHEGDDEGGEVARLIITASRDGSLQAREIELGGGQVVIGRSGDVDVEIGDPTVSRRHASITSTTEGHLLTDLGSANGTWVNGERVTRRVLRHDDSIRFGMAEAGFEEPHGATMLVDVGRMLEGSQRAGSEPPARPPAPAAPPPAASTSPPATPPPRPAPPPGASFGDMPLAQHPAPRPAPPPPARRASGHARPAAAALQSRAYAGFWIRALAAVIDSVLLMVVMGGLWVGTGVAARLLAGRWPAAAVVLAPVGILAAGLVPLVYTLVGWTRSGATPGKRACGLRVVREDGRPLGIGAAVARLIGYMLGSMLLGIGYLMVAFTDRKRGLHDMIASTVVLRR